MTTARERELVRQLRQGWPSPDPVAIELSLALIDRIGAAIDAEGGSIGFDRYMAMALYEPGLGYYSGGLARFGAAGDFITAPLVSPLFSRGLARQCGEVLETLGGGTLLELGAGSGRMAADLLAELQRLGRLPERYWILEVSATLQQQQRQTLGERVPELLARVQWLDAWPAPGSVNLVLANEVLDALPVQRFQVAGGGLEECRVRRDGERLAWTRQPAASALREAVTRLQQDLPAPLAPGYSSEWCPSLPGWIGGLAEVLGDGVVLLIDYGYPRREYYHPQRGMGTLICHYRHRAHDDPLILPGLQDITAFVDFTAVAEAGLNHGLALLGFAPQGQFLVGAGLLELMESAAADASPEQALALAQQVKALTLPGEMGERFKVLALGRNYPAPLRGFALAEHAGRL